MKSCWRRLSALISLLVLPLAVASAQAASAPVQSAPAQAQPSGQAHPDTRAEIADQAWLSLMDAGQYGEGWKATAAMFQARVPQEKFEEGLRSVRSPLGKLTSRKLQDATFHTSLPGAPDGEYIVTVYATSFANKAEAHETVTASHEKAESWRVSGYYIR